jgi:hypothetical protein
MKKILMFALTLCLMMPVIVKADSVRDDSLGNPILNVNDTAVLKRYPGALQAFPSSIFALFNGAANYSTFGVAYKASDMFGLCATYESTPTVFNQQFFVNGALINTAQMAQVASIVYGMKAGTMMAGFSAKVNFYNSATIQSNIIFTNAKVYQWYSFGGFKTTFSPSIVLEMGNMSIYGTVDTTLNFTKVSAITTNESKWSVVASPNTLQQIKVSILAAMKASDTTSLGVELKVGMNDNGYSFQQMTNSGKVYKTNSYAGSVLMASLGIGTSVKASDAALFFFDINGGVNQTTGLHKTDADKRFYNITTVWTLPACTLGAEFELVKNLKLRISAVPSWTTTTVERASYLNLSIPAGEPIRTVVSAFNVASQIGLGLKIGAFVLNWQLDTQFLNKILDTPMQFVNITGGGPALASRVQANFLF